ncbi:MULTISPECIES: PseG/SpsG family protein [Micromonospora]|uniref:PseG/SpsG family protein n=1 Tax=Micromonospora TaxID=1873 RepID=UPI001EE8C0C7|nr:MULTISPECIES: spore coat protein [Micromonospora]MCG5452036.1 spore coat protein [Micromonospora hortensis]MCX5117666.1 spore coat protein [Micromonospora sp. NBC_00362]WTI11301.1 spore coat protein [Micromonospora sp. NBC_00821]
MSTLRVGLRCDAGPRRGVGHLVRCLALAEEFLARGADVTVFGAVERLDWATAELAARGIPLLPGPDSAAELVEAARRHHLDVLVLDSYELDPAGAGALRAAGVYTLAIIDGDSRGQVADLYVDQNFGAELPRPGSVAALPGRLLAGSGYALLRDTVISARPPLAPPTTAVSRPRVLAFFGGTDAVGAAPLLTRVLVATGHPMDLTVIVGRPEIEAEIDDVAPGRGQTIRPVPPTTSLPALITEADLVVSAAGTSTWELCCLGAPSALVCVVDNQRESYTRVVRHGLAAGLGELPELTAVGVAGRATRATAARTLHGLLSSPQRRAALAERAWSTVDGQGRARVVDAVFDAVRTAAVPG